MLLTRLKPRIWYLRLRFLNQRKKNNIKIIVTYNFEMYSIIKYTNDFVTFKARYLLLNIFTKIG